MHAAEKKTVVTSALANDPGSYSALLESRVDGPTLMLLEEQDLRAIGVSRRHRVKFRKWKGNTAFTSDPFFRSEPEPEPEPDYSVLGTEQDPFLDFSDEM